MPTDPRPRSSHPAPKRWPAIIAIVLLTSVLVGFHGDDDDRIHELVASAPGIDVELARHATFDDDDAWLRSCRESGASKLGASLRACWDAVQRDPARDYPHHLVLLHPFLARVSGALATEYHCPEYQQEVSYFVREGAAGYAVHHALVDLKALQLEPSPLRDKRPRYAALRRVFEEHRFDEGIVFVDAALAKDVMQEGLLDERMHLLHAALERARRFEQGSMACQLLGELGYETRVAAGPEASYPYFLEGIALADRRRFPDQAARLRMFLASAYVADGRLAVATDLVREAQRVSREWYGGTNEIRLVFQSMGFFANLGCWTIVAELERRIPILMRDPLWQIEAHDQATYSVDAKVWEARLLSARSRPEAAAELYASIAPDVRRIRARDGYGVLLAEWSDALEKSGDTKKALVICDRGLAFADSMHLGVEAWQLACCRVRALIATHRLAAAESALIDARRRVPQRVAPSDFTSLVTEALAADVALARENRSLARRIVENADRDLRIRIRRLAPGPQADLALVAVEDLHRVTHDVLAADPRAGYRYELEWRSLPACFGRSGDPPSARRSGAADLSSGNSIHLLYAFTSNGLTRWTAARGGIRREVLGLDVATCSRCVDALRSDPSEEEGAGNLAQQNRSLSRLLLPPELFEKGVAVQITADGPLTRLPFELLDVDPSQTYRPLLADHDVVYVRPVPRRLTGPGEGPAIIMANDAKPTLENLSPLHDVEAETRRAMDALPGARVIRAGQNSKQDVLKAWSRAPVFYAAAHLVRDPDVPIVSYFPLSARAHGQRVDDSYLDLRDVCSLDLSGCRLVVLSSCASGEPYVAGERSVPSMADAALDAGAGAAIHTLWDVSDEQASLVAPRLAKAWIEGGNDPLRAFCNARRAIMSQSDERRASRDWAAWSVTIPLNIEITESGWMAPPQARSRPDALVARGAIRDGPR